MSTWTIEIPRANPFRARPIGIGAIDFDAVFPKFDLMALREQYQPQEQPIQYYPDWLVNKEISLQAHISGIEIKATMTNELGVETLMHHTDITPSGWTGYQVHKFTVTPKVIGIYYITLEYKESGIKRVIRFDDFYVNDISKRLVELKFKNSENNMGMVWDAYYTAYYTAIYKESDGEQENSVFKTDTGTSMLNSKDYGGIDVIFCDIQKRYKRTIEKQLRCDSILFNGMECICEANPTSEDTENSDVINITARLTFKNSDDLLTLP
jgi:hypothetical protein